MYDWKLNIVTDGKITKFLMGVVAEFIMEYEVMKLKATQVYITKQLIVFYFRPQMTTIIVSTKEV
jgi:hypothetical protein